ncbi:hypothetical protein LguiB_017390 [Lonicera macranthoides]
MKLATNSSSSGTNFYKLPNLNFARLSLPLSSFSKLLRASDLVGHNQVSPFEEILVLWYVILYKISGDAIETNDDMSFSKVLKKWVHVGYVRVHIHDVRALTVAVPINQEVPDTGCGPSGGLATTDMVARVKTSRKIICITMSTSGALFDYTDRVKPSLFELKKRENAGKCAWVINKMQLPPNLPFAHSMVFSFGSSRLLLVGHDRKIYIVDVGSLELIPAFTPRRKELG